MQETNDYLYSRVKQKIIEYIKDLPLNSRIPTRIELGNTFGVTRTTIDRAISELIGEGYLSSKVGSGTYLINHKATGSSVHANLNWGIILPNVTTDTYPEIIRAVEDMSSKSGINLIICNTDNDVEKQEKYIRQLSESNVSGVVIVPAIESPFASRKGFEILRENGIKFVFCNRAIEGISGPKVVSNDYYGGNIATRHLFANGWKKPAYISKLFYSVSEQRYNGYLNALYDQGIPVDENYIRFEERFDNKISGYEAMKSLLELPEPPDSVFCFNDVIAKGVYLAIEEMGKKVGGDIGVVGYDDSGICESLSTKLTSVRFPMYEIGKRAAEILLRMTNGEEIKDHYMIVLKPELVVRESCGEKINNRLD